MTSDVRFPAGAPPAQAAFPAALWAVCLLVLVAGCGGLAAEEQPVPAHQLLIVQGTVGTLDGCSVGVGAVHGSVDGLTASLSLAGPGSGTRSYVTIERNAPQLVPLCGRFYRVAEVRFGDTRGSVVLDRAPVAAPALARDRLTLIPSAVARLVNPEASNDPVFSVALEVVATGGGPPRARFKTWAGVVRPTLVAEEGTVELGAGEVLEVKGVRWQIGAVVAPGGTDPPAPNEGIVELILPVTAPAARAGT